MEEIFLLKLKNESLLDNYNNDNYLKDLTNAVIIDYIINRLKSIKNHQEGSISEVYHIARNLKKEKCLAIQELFYSFLSDDWHMEHEYIIVFAKKNKSNSAIPHIKSAIESKYDYMMINPENYYSFVRKCMFALKHIDSVESINLIKYYLNYPDKQINKLAKEQIAN